MLLDFQVGRSKMGFSMHGSSLMIPFIFSQFWWGSSGFLFCFTITHGWARKLKETNFINMLKWKIKTKQTRTKCSGEEQNKEIQSTIWHRSPGGQQLSLMVSALFALPKAESAESFWKLLFIHSTSTCLRGPCPREAVLTPSYASH